MNKDQLQTIKNLIQLRKDVGHFPTDLEVQNDFKNIINQAIFRLNNNVFLNHLYFQYTFRGTELKRIQIINFKELEILLDEYQDYLRALEIVLEDASTDHIKEFYLERQEEPNYNHIDKSILIEPLEPTTYIKYVEGTNIAYFNEIDDEDIKKIEQNVLRLLEEHIQK